MKKFFKNLDYLSLTLYLAFGWILGISGVDVVEHTLAFFSLLGILAVVDMRSYNCGLNRGVEIFGDTLKEWK